MTRYMFTWLVLKCGFNAMICKVQCVTVQLHVSLAALWSPGVVFTSVTFYKYEEIYNTPSTHFHSMASRIKFNITISVL